MMTLEIRARNFFRRICVDVRLLTTRSAVWVLWEQAVRVAPELANSVSHDAQGRQAFDHEVIRNQKTMTIYVRLAMNVRSEDLLSKQLNSTKEESLPTYCS